MSVNRTWGMLSIPTMIRGTALGVAAFLVGYALTSLTATGAVRRVATAFEPLASAGGRFAPGWKLAGWAYLDGHFVGTTYPGGAVEVVSMAGIEFLYLVPPLVLLLAGGVLVSVSGSEGPMDGFLTGTTVVFGYLPLVVIFATLLQYANIRPSLLRALVIGGLAYPLVFGGIGGALTAILRGEG